MPDNEDQVPNEDEIQEEQNLDNQEPETPEEDQVEEQSEPEAEEEPETPAEPEPEPQEEKPKEEPSRREQLRVQKLLEKYGDPDKPQQPRTPEGINFREQLEAEEPVYEQLEKQTQEYGTQQYNEGLKRAESIRWETMENIDAPNVAGKHKFLDKESPDFEPAVADAMTRRYLNMVGYDPNTGLVAHPNIRWSEFVEAEMELADRLASTKVENTQKNITRQAAQTGLRPDGSAAKRLNLNQAPETMTDEELDAVIKSSLPRK